MATAPHSAAAPTSAASNITVSRFTPPAASRASRPALRASADFRRVWGAGPAYTEAGSGVVVLSSADGFLTRVGEAKPSHLHAPAAGRRAVIHGYRKPVEHEGA